MLPILVLDLATRLGFAVMRNGGNRQIVSGVHVVAKPRTGVGAFLAGYEDWLAQMLFDEVPAVVVFESPIMPTTTTPEVLRKLIGLAGCTEKMCHRDKITCYEARNSTVLKYFTGYGGGSREERKASVLAECRRLGFKPEDDNEADALAILHYAVHRLGIEGKAA